MSRLLRLTSVHACMVYSNKKIYWSCTPVDLFPCNSYKVCNICSCDCRYIIADPRNSNGLCEETSLFLGEVSCTLNSFVFISCSSPPTFVIVMETFFPSKPRLSAVSIGINLTCAPESKSIFPRF